MKKGKTFRVVYFLVLMVAILTLSALDSAADSWFDSYGDIPWAEEVLHLDNLAIYLAEKEDFIGYVAFSRGNNERVERFRARIARTKKHLIQTRKIDGRRVVVINAGRRENSWTILQPVQEGKPAPKFELE